MTTRGEGLTTARPSITTVGTVSLPSATDRTKAAAAGSREISTIVGCSRRQRSANLSRMQNTHPGRQ